jgi:hypothetical protein
MNMPPRTNGSAGDFALIEAVDQSFVNVCLKVVKQGAGCSDESRTHRRTNRGSSSFYKVSFFFSLLDQRHMERLAVESAGLFLQTLPW